VLLGEGDEPAVAPKTHQVVFTHDKDLWIAPIDGRQPAHRLLFAQGQSKSPAWSPDGKTLAFVSDRGDHSFIALYTSDQAPLRYLAPTTSRDGSPRWSPDGREIAFVREPGQGGAVVDPLTPHPSPWAIWVGDAASLQTRQVWASPVTELGSYPRTAGGVNLEWAAGDRLIFLADLDGWPHLYAVASRGGEPRRLTSGNFMVEYLAMSRDRSRVIYNANQGSDRDDVDRRHMWVVPVDGGAPSPLTSGTGLEWMPVVTGDGTTVAYFSATAQRPPLPAVQPLAGGQARLLAQDQIPADFPVRQLVTPTSVIVQAPDGVSVHGQLFTTDPHAADRRPAIVFVHGGPPRQMLLGWHYMDYYTNSYAVNQYLASRGYVVLSVNYRLGIGYGHAFHHPDHAGARGAAEYQDVLAAARYLQTRPDVDPARIGIWGGSYGGYLTALALARNSDVFKTGVDMHGVHNWFLQMTVDPDPLQVAVGDGVTPAAWKHYLDVIWQSSPDSSIAIWKSPVLLIQGDDDRNVRFHQTVDLAQRLRAAGVQFDELVLPDEIHGFLRHASWLRADEATAAWFDRIFQHGRATQH
jgi:dipeptidyl aminopeptidase/acylaminoacyl peptidase